jgi:hypothetical protein
MTGTERMQWKRDLALPLAVIAIPMVLSVVSWGEWLMLAFPAAAAVGYLLQPARLWVVWLGAVVLMWFVYGGAVLVGLEEQPATDPSQGETWWTFALESFIWMAILTLLPMWIGRLLGRRAGVGGAWQTRT